LQSFLAIESGLAHIDELAADRHHAHEEYVITLMLAGYVTFAGQHRVNVKPGMLTLVPAGMPHSLLQGKDMQVQWLSFATNNTQLDESQELMQVFARIRTGALPIIKLPSHRLEFVVTLFKEIQLELSQAKSPRVLESLLSLMLNETCKASKLAKLDLGPETKINRALQYVERHSCEGISLKDVANHLHMSPAYLAAKMKHVTGYSVGHWITRHKLKLAQELLVNTDEKVEQISQVSGWQDVTHFIRQFKKAHQLTPAAWRRAHRQNDSAIPTKY